MASALSSMAFLALGSEWRSLEVAAAAAAEEEEEEEEEKWGEESEEEATKAAVTFRVRIVPNSVPPPLMARTLFPLSALAPLPGVDSISSLIRRSPSDTRTKFLTSNIGSTTGEEGAPPPPPPRDINIADVADTGEEEATARPATSFAIRLRLFRFRLLFCAATTSAFIRKKGGEALMFIEKKKEQDRCEWRVCVCVFSLLGSVTHKKTPKNQTKTTQHREDDSRTRPETGRWKQKATQAGYKSNSRRISLLKPRVNVLHNSTDYPGITSPSFLVRLRLVVHGGKRRK